MGGGGMAISADGSIAGGIWEGAAVGSHRRSVCACQSVRGELALAPPRARRAWPFSSGRPLEGGGGTVSYAHEFD